MLYMFPPAHVGAEIFLFLSFIFELVGFAMIARIVFKYYGFAMSALVLSVYGGAWIVVVDELVTTFGKAVGLI